MKLKYSYLEDEVLLIETKAAALREKSATLALLEYLAEVDRRKAYATQAYSSLFDYLVRGLRYSESQASERVNALRLMAATPEVKEHLENGELSLTSAAQIQRFIQTEKRCGNQLAPEAKTKLIERCVNQSKREVERVLLSHASAPTQVLLQERVKQITPERSELKFSVSTQTSEKVRAAQELLGVLSLEELFDRALSTLIEIENKKRGRSSASGKAKSSSQDSTQSEKLEKPQASQNSTQHSTLPAVQPKQSGKAPATSAPTSRFSRFIPLSLKREVFARSQGQCEFRDAHQHRCPSRYRLHIDHKKPLALGGTTTITNLRHLCPEHNQRARIEAGL